MGRWKDHFHLFEKEKAYRNSSTSKAKSLFYDVVEEIENIFKNDKKSFNCILESIKLCIDMNMTFYSYKAFFSNCIQDLTEKKTKHLKEEKKNYNKFFTVLPNSNVRLFFDEIISKIKLRRQTEKKRLN